MSPYIILGLLVFVVCGMGVLFMQAKKAGKTEESADAMLEMLQRKRKAEKKEMEIHAETRKKLAAIDKPGGSIRYWGGSADERVSDPGGGKPEDVPPA